MIFDSGRFCRCAGSFAQKLNGVTYVCPSGGEAPAGSDILAPSADTLPPGGENARREGALFAALVRAGQCILRDPDGNRAGAGTGCIILSPVSLLLEPLGACQTEGLFLRGMAADELARGMDGPAVLQPRGCAAAAETLAALAQAGQRLRPEEAGALAYTLCCRLAGADGTAAALSPLIETALGMLHEHFAELYGIDELCRELGVSKGHFCRAFAREMGVTPGKYLTRVRVSRAKGLLLGREYTLEAVAALCGFSGANYFCKVFRRETGDTPGAWRSRAAPGAWRPRRGEAAEERLYL